MKLLLKVHSERIARRRRATPEPTSLPPSRDVSKNNSERVQIETNQSKCCTRNTYLFIILTLLMLITGSIIVYVELTRTPSAPPKKSRMGPTNFDTGGLNIVSREIWGAQDNIGSTVKLLTLPVSYVIISHVGVEFPECASLNDCFIAMRSVQESAVRENGLPDLPCNFYISPQGTIFVGRGYNRLNAYATGSLCIALLGDYTVHKPSNIQVANLREFIENSVKNGVLVGRYKVIGLQQIKPTGSPGKNVISLIEKWSKFARCGNGYSGIQCGKEVRMEIGDWKKRH